jgi:hypothetical protein
MNGSLSLVRRARRAASGFVGALLGLVVFVFGAASAEQAASAQPPASASRSQLAIVGVDVQPANPGPDTLCKLHVRLRNAGRDGASDLSFQITVNGQRLAPYLNHNFRTFVAPGKETDLPLYNFWSSESGRPFPSDGRLVIDVRVIGARWVTAGSTNVATLAGPVDPLPAPFSVTLTARDKR